MLKSLDVTESMAMGDDEVSPRILKSCAQSLCVLLTSLFHKICRHTDFSASCKISRVTPVLLASTIIAAINQQAETFNKIVLYE